MTTTAPAATTATRTARRTRTAAMSWFAATLVVASAYAAPKASELPVRIPLAPLGFQTLSQSFLRSGSSMLSVDFVDEGHLLVTFGVRRLMKRDTVIDERDQDRTIGAYLLELPTGKVVAQTEWRMHDHGQYLWNLGKGRFLLRIRDHVSILAPLRAADPGQAFEELPFLNVDRRIAAIVVSAERDLLTLETEDPPMAAAPAPTGGSAGAGFATARNPSPVQINFYRLAEDETGKRALTVVAAGVLRARGALALPVTAPGYLDVLQAGRGKWSFQFDTHGGKVSQLAGFESTCFPRTTFVSGSEFVAFGCRSGSDKQTIGGFNLRGEQMWQQGFYDYSAGPTFDFAPAAGRFALGRTILSSPAEAGFTNVANLIQSQEVRVYQTDTGKQIFRAECSPVERAGQNFALSPSGMQLAVVRETMERRPVSKIDETRVDRPAEIAIFPLPALSAADEIAVKEAREIVPADGFEPIRLTTRTAAVGAAGKPAAGAAVVDSPASAPVAAPAGAQEMDTLHSAGGEAAPAPGPTMGDSPAASGDTEPGIARKPPTLYGPDEAPAKPQ